MIKQSQIKRRLEHPNSIDTVRSNLMRSELGSRAALADAVCQDFGFLDSRSATQRAGCAKALRELEQAGHFVLPVGQPRGPSKKRATKSRRVPHRSNCVTSP